MSARPLRRLLAVILALSLTTAVAACGSEDSSSSSSTTASSSSEGGGKYAANLIEPVSGASSAGEITIGSKNFTEQFILGNIYADALRAAGFDIKKQLNIGSEVLAYRSLKSGRVDAYPEYTGTSLGSFFDVKIEDIPRDAAQAYADTKAAYAEEDITALAPTPFENTYRLGMVKSAWQKAGSPRNMTELAQKAPGLSITGFPECRQRPDCLIGVQDTYGGEFGEFVGSNQTYQTIDKGEADVGFLFTTDGPLASGKYQLIDDDKKFFPPYNVSFGIRNDALQKLGPQGQKIITDVQKYMTEEVMQQLNARADIQKQSYDEVAQTYLKAYGFIK